MSFFRSRKMMVGVAIVTATALAVSMAAMLI